MLYKSVGCSSPFARPTNSPRCCIHSRRLRLRWFLQSVLEHSTLRVAAALEVSCCLGSMFLSLPVRHLGPAAVCKAFSVATVCVDTICKKDTSKQHVDLPFWFYLSLPSYFSKHKMQHCLHLFIFNTEERGGDGEEKGGSGSSAHFTVLFGVGLTDIFCETHHDDDASAEQLEDWVVRGVLISHQDWDFLILARTWPCVNDDHLAGNALGRTGETYPVTANGSRRRVQDES